MKKRMIPGWAIFIMLFTLLFCANAEEEEKSRQYVLFSWEREMFSPEEETLDLYVAPLRAADCIDYAKVIMGTLGHKVFEPLNKPVIVAAQASNDTVAEDAIELHLERTIKNVGKVEANEKQTTEGFVVLQGSRISPVDDDTVPAVIKERRVNLPL